MARDLILSMQLLEHVDIGNLNEEDCKTILFLIGAVAAKIKSFKDFDKECVQISLTKI